MKGVEEPITAEGFNHLHLNVRDLARSIRFYKEAFGLKVSFSAGPELIFMVPEAGGHSLALHLVKCRTRNGVDLRRMCLALLRDTEIGRKFKLRHYPSRPFRRSISRLNGAIL